MNNRNARRTKCQMLANNNKDENLEAINRLTDETAGLGAQMVALPEMFNFKFDIIISLAIRSPELSHNLGLSHIVRLFCDTMAVQSIERAFTLLRTIAQHPTGISVTALAEQTKLHKSTVSRLVISLEAERAVECDNGSLRIGNGIPL